MNDRQIVRVDLDHGDVGLLVRADESRLKFAAILQFHINALGPVDDVMVREDETVCAHDEARAFALHRRHAARVLPRIAIRLILEEEIVECRIVIAVVLLRHLDDHDARRHDLEYFRERAVQLMNDILAGFRRFRSHERCRDGLRLTERRCGLQRSRADKRGQDQEGKQTHRCKFGHVATVAVQIHIARYSVNASIGGQEQMRLRSP